MRIVVSIPTTNRSHVIGATVRDIARQTRKPDLVCIVIAENGDVDLADLGDLPFPVEVHKAERGLTAQRNAALSMLKDNECLLFLDDDFLMAPDYLANLEKLFGSQSDIVMATGKVLADGIHGPGLSHEYGQAQCARLAGYSPDSEQVRDLYNCYGCNMAVRGSTVIKFGVRFDERLRLYGWLEDVDFSRQMAAYGRIVKSNSLQGVHLGTKMGRSKGVTLGYSQIANPLYLARKGTMSPLRVLNIAARNLVSNSIKSLRPEPEVDRMGRLKGNWKAIADLFRGRLDPERILDLK